MTIGRFYFKETASGNLIGEYSHRDSTPRIVYGEAATRTSTGIGWIGEYRTVWREGPDNTVSSAILRISQATASASLFHVEWLSETEPRRQIFVGEAMVCENILIGDYTEQ